MHENTRFQGLRDALDRIIDSGLQAGLVAGTVVTVAHDGQPVYQRAAGYADPEKQIPMRADTIFRLASISKAFTSLAAAALWQQGKLAPDAPVTRWLPYFTPKTIDGNTPVITIRHLLTHTSGLDYRWAQPPDGPYAQAGVSDGLDISGITLDENLERLATVPLLFEPGTAWRYSLSTDVLGAVIAKAQGASLDEAMKALVTGPLGMNDTGFYITEKDRERVAVPYYLQEGRLARMAERQIIRNPEGWPFVFSPDRPFHPAEYPSGGVGMNGTAPELLRLVEAIRTNRFPGIGEDIMRQMSANQLPEGIVTDPGTGHGFGWYVILDPAAANVPLSAGTRGWGGVYGHKWFTDPARKLSVIILTTTAMEETMTGSITGAVCANLP